MGITAGFGGEYIGGGVGLGVEFAAAGLGTVEGEGCCLNPNTIGMGSADLFYHFFRKKVVAPFVAGGYTTFFGQDTDTRGGNHTNGYNVGGGVDLFASKHGSLRFDVRYNGHGGRILWASFPNDAQLDFLAFRIGFTFR
jgi:hypothetical protein